MPCYRFMQQFYDLAKIASWDRFYRTHFINSLSGFKSASLIATANAARQTNLAIFSNIVHLGADPALIGFVNRPKEAAPHTIANIEATGIYSINLIDAGMVEKAHLTSAKFPEGVSEFKAVQLTPQWEEGFACPLVRESKVKYMLSLQQIIPIEMNRSFFVIGAVQAVWVEDALLEEDGFIALEKADIVTSLGIDGYYTTQRMNRYAYAKPDRPTLPL